MRATSEVAAMGALIDGRWVDGELPGELSASGAFQRPESIFRDSVTADGSSGFKAGSGRYHLYAAHGCPWAHRALIYRAIKKLESVISVAYAIPGLGRSGWTFERNDRYPDCLPDEVNGFRHPYEAYIATDPDYTGKVTVPTLWDTKTKRIVNNESSEIIRMSNAAFNAITGDRTDFYPPPLRVEIDAVDERVYRTVNNGVYRAGFANSQSAYDEAYDELFETLDWLAARLSRQRYLVGNQITEADWRLFPTLVRFDVAYFPLFKCNRQRIADYPNLSNYMRELYQVSGIAATVKPRYYLINYNAIAKVNPTRIIPKGTPIDLDRPHDRARRVKGSYTLRSSKNPGERRARALSQHQFGMRPEGSHRACRKRSTGSRASADAAGRSE
jgi:glutathionyl-hydroquinone reductase